MAKITPAPSFGGRFAAKDLKEFYDAIGKYCDHIKTPEELDNRMLAAWEASKNSEKAGGLRWSIYSVPGVDSLIAHMKEAMGKRREADTHPDGPADAAENPARSSPLPEFLENFIENSSEEAWELAVYDLALLRAVETGDVQVLRRGIEEKVRYSYVRDRLYLLPEDKPSFFVLQNQSRPERSLVFDHKKWMWTVLDAYAGGRPDLARRFFRRGVGLTAFRASEFEAQTTNLCMTAMYDDADWKAQTLLAAAAYRKKTKAVYERAFVDFFAAVLEQDAPLMSECLSVLAQGSPKLMWFRDMNNKRIFNCALHGMYAFAAAHLPEGVFRGVKRPEAAWWWDEYADLIEGIILSGIRPAPAGPLFPLSGEAACVSGLLSVIDAPPLK